MIDDQVHFREPGLTHKGTIASESRAAVAGGTTSFMEMPNVNPQTTTIDALEAKYQIAANSAAANYSFYLVPPTTTWKRSRSSIPNSPAASRSSWGLHRQHAGGQPETLAAIFRESPVMIVTHCEGHPVHQGAGRRSSRQKWGEDVPMREHGRIRSADAC